MGEIKQVAEAIDIVAELTKDNPGVKVVKITIYADALRTYVEASLNIEKNGAICSHPRTGTPIENPYLKIQLQQGRLLGKMPGIKADRVLGLLMLDKKLDMSL